MKLRTLEHVRTVKIVKNPEINCSGTFLVGISWSQVMCSGLQVRDLEFRRTEMYDFALEIRNEMLKLRAPHFDNQYKVW